MVKVVGCHIMVKDKTLRIAILLEKTDNPLLLFGCQQPFATMVAIIGCMTTQIVLHRQAQCLLMLTLYF